MLSAAAQAQTNVIYADVGDLGAALQKNVNVTWTLLDPNPRTYNGIVINQTPKSQASDANGRAWFTNMIWGKYRVDVAGTPGTSYKVTVGTNTMGLVNLAAVIQNPGTLPPNSATNYYTQAQIDALLSGIGGGGTTYTNNTDIVGKITGSGIGSNWLSLATAASLTGVSNTVITLSNAPVNLVLNYGSVANTLSYIATNDWSGYNGAPTMSILGIGDSLFANKFGSAAGDFRTVLQNKFGDTGEGFGHAVAFAANSGYTTNDFTYSLNGQYFVLTNGSVTFDLDGAGLSAHADHVQVFYYSQSGGGGFSVQAAQNGGSYAWIGGVNTSGGATKTLLMTNISVPEGWYTTKLVSSNNGVAWIAGGGWNNRAHKGAATYCMAMGGIDWDNFSKCSSTVLSNYGATIKPQLITVEETSSSNLWMNGAAYVITNIVNGSIAAGQTPDVWVVTPNPMAANDAANVSQIGAMKLLARQYGWGVFDQHQWYINNGGTNWMLANDSYYAGAGAGVHPGSANRQASVDAFWTAIGLPNRSGNFKNNPLTRYQPSGQDNPLTIEDEQNNAGYVLALKGGGSMMSGNAREVVFRDVFAPNAIAGGFYLDSSGWHFIQYGGGYIPLSFDLSGNLTANSFVGTVGGSNIVGKIGDSQLSTNVPLMNTAGVVLGDGFSVVNTNRLVITGSPAGLQDGTYWGGFRFTGFTSTIGDGHPVTNVPAYYLSGNTNNRFVAFATNGIYTSTATYAGPTWATFRAPGFNDPKPQAFSSSNQITGVYSIATSSGGPLTVNYTSPFTVVTGGVAVVSIRSEGFSGNGGGLTNVSALTADHLTSSGNQFIFDGTYWQHDGLLAADSAATAISAGSATVVTTPVLTNAVSTPGTVTAATFTGNGTGLTNIPHLETLTSTNLSFRFTRNTDGSTNAELTITNLAGLSSGGGGQTQWPSSAITNAIGTGVLLASSGSTSTNQTHYGSTNNTANNSPVYFTQANTNASSPTWEQATWEVYGSTSTNSTNVAQWVFGQSPAYFSGTPASNPVINRPDIVTVWGYNINGVGAQVNTNEPAFHEQFESAWQYAGSTAESEWHWDYNFPFATNGGGYSFRPFNLNFRWNTNCLYSTVYWNLQGDTFNFYHPSNTSVGGLGWTISGGGDVVLNQNGAHYVDTNSAGTSLIAAQVYDVRKRKAAAYSETTSMTGSGDGDTVVTAPSGAGVTEHQWTGFTRTRFGTSGNNQDIILYGKTWLEANGIDQLNVVDKSVAGTPTVSRMDAHGIIYTTNIYTTRLIATNGIVLVSNSIPPVFAAGVSQDFYDGTNRGVVGTFSGVASTNKYTLTAWP